MAPKRKNATEPTRLRVNVSIDATLRKRLGAYASFHRLTESQIVESAVSAALAGFYCGQREAGASVTITTPAESGPPSVLPIRAG